MQTTTQESVSDLTRQGVCLAFFTAYDDLNTARMIGLPLLMPLFIFCRWATV